MRASIPSVNALLAAGLITASRAVLVPPVLHDEEIPVQPFDWQSVQSTTSLKFQKCYDGNFECAKLAVPLDWNDLANPNNISIAIIRVPAVVNRADASYGGTIIVNPGGPGGSGTDIILSTGRSLQELVDSDKHFDILSFDPRGVKYTTPNVACFEDDAAREVLNVFGIGAGGLDEYPDSLNVKWGIDQGLGYLCQTSGYFEDGSNIRQFVSTALVARDMVAIVDKLDDHLTLELQSGSPGTPQRQQVLAGHSSSGVPLLNYWGLSYGTYLGNTFASMFPDRIGRVILDGVVDADDYAATGWTSNLRDNEKTWAKFFEYCFEAGARCALYNPSYESPGDMQEHVEAFLEHLKDNPIPLVLNGNASILTYYMLKISIHTALYFPKLLWPILAYWLQALDAGDFLTAASIIESGDLWRHHQSRGFSPSLPPIAGLHQTVFTNCKVAPLPQYGYPWQLEAAVSVLCGDGDDITSRTKANHTEYLHLLESQSKVAAAVWAEITLRCVHWPKSLRPSAKNRFTGPFESKLSDYNPKASPILFIGNTADPVTPVHNAHKMSKRHEGSVVLTQNVPGHCSADINPSTCLYSVVKAFFANGTLPKSGLVCEDIQRPWG